MASAGEIEHWVTVNDMSPGRVILDARTQREEHPWPIAAGVALKQQLYGRKHRRNPIIEKAWSEGPWQQLATLDREKRTS
ncbi:hypothetical protein [Nocardioides pyridinolyticus]